MSRKKLRVVSWNMSHWQRRAQADEAWRYLKEDVRPDIALLQEAMPLSEYKEVVYREIGGRRRWGSAILSFGPKMEEITAARSRNKDRDIPLLRTHPGSVAIAQVYLDAGDPVTVISVYGLIDEGYADTTLHRILSDLTPLFDDPRYNRRLVLAGDLNVCTQWSGRRAHLRARDATVFDRLRALGLVDCIDLKTPADRGPLAGCNCVDGNACRHTRTQRHHDDPESFPWQNDYVFATQSFAAHLISCGAVDDAKGWALSSHCPILAVFEL